MSIRRFTNPHLGLQQLQTASRADLYPEDGHLNRHPTGDIEGLQTLLTETLQPPLKHSRTEDDSLPRTKRRKVDKEPTPVLFRLVSSSLPPLPVSLLPPTPPSPISRGPDAEDNEAQALLRNQRSEVVAVDGTSILFGANPTKTQGNDRVINITVQIPTPAPPMCVMMKQQPSRKTRPPVPSAKLIYHPYNSRGKTNPTALSKAKCTVVDAESSGSKFKSSRRQRRKRLKQSTRQRPPPRFWRPEPSLSGPCRGYAFGYPSSFGGEGYQRDRMKKAICDL